MTEQKRYTDEEIKQRFEMAENHCDKLEEQLVKDCPAEIVDKFRVGDDKELFRVLLIAPGMQLEEGIWSVQSAPDVDVELDLPPAELLLECGPSLDCKYRVRVRTKAPTAEELVEPEMHHMKEPETWEEVATWARSLVALGIINADKGDATDSA